MAYLQVARHAKDGFGLEQVGVVVNVALESTLPLDNVQNQVHVCAADSHLLAWPNACTQMQQKATKSTAS